MVEPLRARTMGLSELQLAVLDLIRKVRFQFDKPPYAEGLSDNEFIELELDPLETQIYQDRSVLKMKRQSKRGEA